MKRGLKEGVHVSVDVVIERYNRFPDEKGTERGERQTCESRFICYNRFPDEKGTERFHLNLVLGHCKVTTVSPMKRGLKVSLQLFVRVNNARIKLQPFPR